MKGPSTDRYEDLSKTPSETPSETLQEPFGVQGFCDRNESLEPEVGAPFRKEPCFPGGCRGGSFRIPKIIRLSHSWWAGSLRTRPHKRVAMIMARFFTTEARSRSGTLGEKLSRMEETHVLGEYSRRGKSCFREEGERREEKLQKST